MFEALEAMRCMLLCILEGALCLREMSEVLQVFEALEVSEVMCCVLLCMLEAVDDELCLLEELGVMRCLLEDAVWRVGSVSWFQKIHCAVAVFSSTINPRAGPFFRFAKRLSPHLEPFSYQSFSDTGFPYLRPVRMA